MRTKEDLEKKVKKLRKEIEILRDAYLDDYKIKCILNRSSSFKDCYKVINIILNDEDDNAYCNIPYYSNAFGYFRMEGKFYNPTKVEDEVFYNINNKKLNFEDAQNYFMTWIEVYLCASIERRELLVAILLEEEI